LPPATYFHHLRISGKKHDTTDAAGQNIAPTWHNAEARRLMWKGTANSLLLTDLALRCWKWANTPTFASLGIDQPRHIAPWRLHRSRGYRLAEHRQARAPRDFRSLKMPQAYYPHFCVIGPHRHISLTD